MSEVYVTCLAAYNAGTPHGAWIDLSDLCDSDMFDEAIDNILKSSPASHAEEWAVHDYDDFPDLGEHPSRLEIVETAKLIKEYGDVYLAAWSCDANYAKERCEDSFIGVADSFREYCEQSLEEDSRYSELSDFGKMYFKLDSYVRDMESELTAVEYDGRVYVFSS